MSKVQTQRPYDSTNLDYGYPNPPRQADVYDSTVSSETYVLYKELKKIRKILEYMVETHHEERQQDTWEGLLCKVLQMQDKSNTLDEVLCDYQEPWQWHSVSSLVDPLEAALKHDKAIKKLRKMRKKQGVIL